MASDSDTELAELVAAPANDPATREQLAGLLAQCRHITAAEDAFPALERIALKTKEIIKADRVTIFLLDRTACELRSFVS